jgi:hypothetical protein
LVYHSIVRYLSALILAGLALAGFAARAQEDEVPHHADSPKSEPAYSETFSGPIVEFSDAKIIVSRSILGKPAEKRTFLINSDTRIEGKLRVKVRVTVGFVSGEGGDVARLIVVRSTPRPAPAPKK